jgi:inward rectifier potassium channel
MAKNDIGKLFTEQERIQQQNDLGIGSQASQQTVRQLNRDGSFNVERRGLPITKSLNLYHQLLTMSWWKFNAMVLALYLTINLFYTALYMIVGMDHMHGVEGKSFTDQLLEAFFFSSQTFTTVGYGRVNPMGFWSNMVAAMESLTGLLGFALATGMLYGRFSRPYAKILYSDNAVVAPYRGITAFMFRVANLRSNQLIEVEAELTLSLLQEVNGQRARQYYVLELERRSLNFFPLSWTVVHPIIESSPLFGMSKEKLLRSEAEFFILFKGFDDAFSQTVHSRTSYRAEEVEFDVKFAKIISIAESGKSAIDLDRLNEFEPA